LIISHFIIALSLINIKTEKKKSLHCQNRFSEHFESLEIMRQNIIEIKTNLEKWKNKMLQKRTALKTVENGTKL